MLKAVIFDLDGTLIDSKQIVFNSTKAAFSALGLPAPDTTLMQQHSGKGLRSVVGLLVPTGYNGSIELIMSEINNQQIAMSNRPQLFTGMGRVIDELSRNFQLGIATNRSKNVPLFLDHLGLANLFHTVITAADVKNQKPHPESLGKAIDDLSVKPHEAVYIGDTTHDILAAQALGMHNIFVDWGWHEYEDLQNENINPDHRVFAAKELLQIIQSL